MIFGSYIPKNAYGFRIYKKDAKGKFLLSDNPVLDYIQTVGPCSYTEQFKYRISYSPTFGSTSVIDFGQGNNEIKIDGEWHIYHTQAPPDVKAWLEGGSTWYENAAAQGANRVQSTVTKFSDRYTKMINPNMRSGREEFFDFLFLLYFSRQTNKYQTETNMSTLAEALEGNSGKERFNYRDYALVFVDYDNQRNLEVILPQDGFTFQRSTSDTNTYKYSIKLVVLNDLLKIDNKRVSAPINPAFTLAGVINVLDTLISLPLVFTGALVNISSIFSATVTSLRGVNDRIKIVQKQMKADGKLAQSTFNGALDEVKKSLGGGSKKQWNPETISQAIDDAIKNERRITAELQEKFASAENSLSGLLAFMRVSIFGNSQSQQNQDESSIIQEPLYQWIIDAQSAIVSAQAAIFYATSDIEFRPIEVKPGDSYNSIAFERLGNREFGRALAIYNKDQFSSIIKRSSIKIPFGFNTGIYSKLPENPTANDMEIALQGIDIKLTEGRDIAVSPNGDIGIIFGDEAVINNVLDIIDSPEGSWQAHPELGNPIPIGEIPDSNPSNLAIERFIAQIKADPRVESVSFQGVTQEADNFYYVFNFRSILGKSYFIQL
ncbi:MAG: hypothetical protein MUF77_07925 [Leptospira sp.]|nr:hypothetical protein [Leptospira sp.]